MPAFEDFIENKWCNVLTVTGWVPGCWLHVILLLSPFFPSSFPSGTAQLVLIHDLTVTPSDPLSVCLASPEAALPALSVRGVLTWEMRGALSHILPMPWSKQWISLWVQSFHFSLQRLSCLSPPRLLLERLRSLVHLVKLGKAVFWLQLTNYLTSSRPWWILDQQQQQYLRAC